VTGSDSGGPRPEAAAAHRRGPRYRTCGCAASGRSICTFGPATRVCGVV